MRPTTVRVWADIREHARCRFCRKSIVWVTTDRAKKLPFDDGYTVRETVTDDKLRRFDVLAYSDLHHCPQRPRKPAPTGARLF